MLIPIIYFNLIYDAEKVCETILIFLDNYAFAF